MIIGLVLGSTFADNVHLTQSIYGWSFLIQSPLADVFLGIGAILLVLITWRGRGGGAVITPQRAGRGPRRPHPVLEPTTDAVIAAVSIAYVVIALGYPAAAGGIPAIVGGIGAAVALLRLLSWAYRMISDARRLTGQAAHSDAELTMATADSARAVPGASLPQGADDPVVLRLPGAGCVPEAGPPAPAAGQPQQPTSGPLVPAGGETSRHRTVREFIALGWIWASMAATYLFGFQIGVPLVAGAYCLVSLEWSRRWQRLAFAVAVTGAACVIATGFVSLFHLTFSGLLA